MSNAIGLRDQRVSVYGQRNDGKNGYSSPYWQYLYALWARLDVVSEQQQAGTPPQAHTQYLEQVKVTFAYTAIIPRDSLLKLGDAIYFVRGVVRQRFTWTTTVRCERIPEEQFASYLMYNGDDTSDGVHLVESSST